MVYDEILEAKVKLEYGKLNRFNNPRYDWVRKKEEQILGVVLRHDDGIAHGQLSRKVGLYRKNLRHYMKRLIDKGLVTRGEGSHGMYYPTTKARRGISLTADILGSSFLSGILENDNFIVDIPSSNEFHNYSKLEHELLKLSNMFGGFMIYSLIQSMNPANKITQGLRNVIEKDIAVRAWLEDTISRILTIILPHFKDRIFPHLNFMDDHVSIDSSDSEIFDKAGEDYLKFFHKRPFFILEESIISELGKSFSNLYPNLSLVLEKTRSDLPNLLAQEINHIRYVAERAKLQKACSHNFKQPLNESYDDHRFEHCQKCHKTRIKEN